MTINSLRKLLKEALKEAELEILAEEPDLTDEELKELLLVVKNKLIEQSGIDPQEFLEYEEALKEIGREKGRKKKEELQNALQETENRIMGKLPPQQETLSRDAILSLVDDSIKQTPIQKPQIINKIEKIVEKPTTKIIREKEVVKEIDQSALDEVKNDIQNIQETIGDVVSSIPEPVDLESFRQVINKDSADIANKLWGQMPNFRALAMGLQGQIDELKNDESSGEVNKIIASTGISISPTSGIGSVTITNSAPDQTVALTGAGISVVSGTYPNFTITSTETDPVFNAWLIATPPLYSVTTHNVLSTTHGDTAAGSVVRGDVMIGNSTPKWDNLALGTVGKILRSDGTDLLYSTLTIPDTVAISSIPYATAANVLGVSASFKFDGTNLTLPAGGDIRPSADSTTAINIAQADGTDFVTFDTTNKRVGIGTTAPTVKLDIAPTNDGDAVLQTRYTSGSASYLSIGYRNILGYGGNTIGWGQNGYAMALSVDSTSNINFNAGQMYIKQSNGNVGIGTTSPICTLQVKGYVADPTLGIIRADSNTGTNDVGFKIGSIVGAGATGYAFIQGIHTGVANDANLILNSQGGNVGIGTTAPGEKLEVTGNIQLTTDGNLLKMGTGEDMTVQYTGTVGKIDTSLVAASDLQIACGTDKTLVLTETVYNDANVGGLVLRTGGTAPGVVQWLDNDGDATGLYTIGFDVNEQGSGCIEVPHDYKEGTDLVFHIHYGINDAPTGTDQIRFDLIYSVQRDGTTFVDATTIDSADVAVDTQYKTDRIDFTAITGTNFKIGDQFNFTIKRTTAVGDAFAGEVLAQTLGFHYQCDTLGSRQIGTK